MNILQRLPQSTKIALAGLLLVGGVATWYFALFRPNQVPQNVTTPTPNTAQPNTSQAATAKPLEVLPLPFLVTEAPKQPATSSQTKSSTIVATPPRITVPPNPFVPLVVETQTPTPAITATPTPAAATPPVQVTRPPTSTPIPTQATVQVRQPTTPLPSSTLQNTTRPSLAAVQAKPRLATAQAGSSGIPGSLSLSTGALPIRLAPLDRELPQKQAASNVAPALSDTPADSLALDFAKAELDAKVAQTLEPRSNAATPKPSDAVAVSNLAKYVRDQNLKLAGVVLGPTSVGIFDSKDGFVVLAVGRTLPGSDILLKSLSVKEALLVQGSESLNLEIVNP